MIRVLDGVAGIIDERALDLIPLSAELARVRLLEQRLGGVLALGEMPDDGPLGGLVLLDRPISHLFGSLLLGARPSQIRRGERLSPRSLSTHGFRLHWASLHGITVRLHWLTIRLHCAIFNWLVHGN